MTATLPEVSDRSVLLVIPAFRESRRLPIFLTGLLFALRESRLPVRVRVVDDGSPEPEREAVAALCRSLSPESPALLPMMALPCNLGKGGAVYAGWAAETDAHWLGFCDADGSVAPDEIIRLIRILLDENFGADALIASRLSGGPRSVSRSPGRAVLSRLFALWVRLMTKLPVHDSQCGCKFVRRSAFARISPAPVEFRFAFDVELLFRLSGVGASIREEPVVWVERPGGSLSVLRDGARMALTVLRIGLRR